MRKASCMAEKDYDVVEDAMEKLMTPKVVVG
jgi:hypothetical protein